MKVRKADSIARRVREAVLGSSERHWRVEELGTADEAKAVNDELRRLLAAGEVRRVRRGVYWRGRRTAFGMVPGSAAEAARAEIDPQEAVGAAGWYAANLLGLSTQVSPIEVLAVTRRPPSGFPGVRFVNRASRTGRRDEGLTDLEVTVLEALDGWDRHVELPPEEAVERLLALLRRKEVRIERLVRASATEPASVRERLRLLLLRLDRPGLADRVPPARSPATRKRVSEAMGRA